jgi:hypothetical protein
MSSSAGSSEGKQRISFTIEGLTLDDVEQQLTESYADPVGSRLYEAARAKLVAPQTQAVPKGHLDETTHWDVTVG